jgi:hypothetical protein
MVLKLLVAVCVMCLVVALSPEEEAAKEAEQKEKIWKNFIDQDGNPLERHVARANR